MPVEFKYMITFFIVAFVCRTILNNGFETRDFKFKPLWQQLLMLGFSIGFLGLTLTGIVFGVLGIWRL